MSWTRVVARHRTDHFPTENFKLLLTRVFSRSIVSILSIQIRSPSPINSRLSTMNLSLDIHYQHTDLMKYLVMMHQVLLSRRVRSNSSELLDLTISLAEDLCLLPVYSSRNQVVRHLCERRLRWRLLAP